MADNGFLPLHLFALRAEWDSRSVKNVQDSYGQEWVSEPNSSVKKGYQFYPFSCRLSPIEKSWKTHAKPDILWQLSLYNGRI
jgi:hypothetical protein